MISAKKSMCIVILSIVPMSIACEFSTYEIFPY